MVRYKFRLPDIGEGIAEAEIVAWHVQVGDRVEEDGPLADMMTDKATVEMESPVAGTVVELAGEVGDNVAIGAPLVVIETDGAVEEVPAPKAEVVEKGIDAENPDARDVERAADAKPGAGRTMGSGRADRKTESSAGSLPQLATPAQALPVDASPATLAPYSKVLASPAVRARAKELGIDLAQVRPTLDGRVRQSDLDAFVSYTPPYRAVGRQSRDQIVKVIGLRRRIADAMSASKRHIPHFSYVEECDVTELEAARATLNENRGERPRLTLLPFLIAAICRSIPEFPMMNARYDEEAGVVTRHGSVHLGIATQTAGGLMVPILRDAQDRNLWQLAGEITRLAEAARDGSIHSEELSGSTLTITSLGALGGIASTPVINRPEVAIIGPNRIVDRPMFVPDGLGGERIAKRKMMNLSISCDHRVVDGWDAANFVQAVRRLLEAPALLLAG
jgi:2-oxoisovalerate dehydrogenase E2 component (dihydrolipoyl transacylase)